MSEESLIPRAASSATASFSALFSKPARRVYLNTALSILASFVLLGVSAIAYLSFYYNYVPQLGLERHVHLQFGDGHPFGTALLGPELASAQQYDVSVELHLPRTPANLATGNFMLDLSLLSAPGKDSTDTSALLLAHSRRPAILTYSSPMVDTANRITRMPLYIFGWKREAETLRIAMMERVEFSKGKTTMPYSLRLELQSFERMQVYNALVRFDARFSGLRWVMYNWRIVSFITFTTVFWVASMASATAVWMALSSREEQRPASKKAEARMPSRVKGESIDDSSVKEESDDDSLEERSLSEESAGPSRAQRSPKPEEDETKQVKREEEIEESTMIDPLAGDAGDQGHEAGRSTQSRFNAGDIERNILRRKARDFKEGGGQD